MDSSCTGTIGEPDQTHRLLRFFGALVIPTNARKKFQFNIAPSDRQLWAIGMVVVQWSSVEQMVKVFVHSFTDENESDDPVRKEFDLTRSLASRLDQWEKLTKQYVQADWLQPMLDLINETRHLADMRDKIIHGAWSDKENALTAAHEAHGPFSWGKPGHPFSWKLDYGGILKVALRIDQLQYQMFQLALKASGVGNSGADFRIGSALRRLQNLPNRS